MTIDETEARDIAHRWGKAAGSEPLLLFAKTGLVADRKRLTEAVKGIRTFLKYPDDIDRLLAFIQHRCPYETAARAQGWNVEDDKVRHVHDYDQAVTYPNWKACCEGEDIPVPK
jgi:hypothetical protein